MIQRIATLVASLALVGALFAGVPSAAKATGTDYIAITGVTYTGAHASNCNSTSYKVNGSNDNTIIDNVFNDLEGEGTLYFCAGTYHFTGQLYEIGDFTITGAGPATTILDGGDAVGLFSIEGDLSLSNLTFQHAHTTDVEGGAILADGNVDVDNAVFDHNLADKGGAAIAVYHESMYPITVTNSTFTNNTALDAGGALATFGTVDVTDSTFANNTSTADENCVGGGGAIAAGNDVHSLRSTFTNNTADLGESTNLSDCWDSAGQLGGFGGAILTGGLEFITASKFTHNIAANGGGAIAAFGGAPTVDPRGIVENSAFAGNDVTVGTYVEVPFAFGGNAIMNMSLGLSISGSSFTSNGHRLTVDGYTAGAAVMSIGYCECDGSISVVNSTFAGNFGVFGGALAGTHISVSRSTFTGNTALATGGAITGTELTIDASTFVGNRALRGGAVWYCGDSVVTNSTFKRNVAELTSDLSSGVGGALGGASLLTVTGTRFTANRAARAGGAIWFTASAAANLATMTKNRFVANRSRKAGGAIGFNSWYQTVTRSQIATAARKNRFSANTAARGANINGLAVYEGP